MNKIFRLYILFAFFFTAGIFAFADGPSLALHGKSSVDIAAVVKQAEEDYSQAVELYKNKKFAKAKKKFKEVSFLVSDYKDTMNYLALIDRYVWEKQEKALQDQRQQELTAPELKYKEEFLRQQRLKALELKHRKEFLRQQAQEREERQHQAQLEARRKAVRKQLEDGVEAMYREALRLYKQGDYMAAADKFKDVQDILPGYKRVGQYMGEVRLKSLTVNPPLPSVSRQDVVSKVLDLFESNAK